MTRPYDLAVVGAGFAGFGAAVTAARMGLRTLLIEKGSGWGGTAQAARHRYICGLYGSGPQMPLQTLNAGLAAEIEFELREEGAEITRIGQVFALRCEDGQAAEIFSRKAAAEKNLDTFFNACLVGIEKDGEAISALRVRAAGKIETFLCRAALDCGSGALIVQSGAGYDLAPASERPLGAYAVTVENVLGPVEDYKIAYQLKMAAERGDLAPHLRFSVWMPGAPGRGILRLSILPSDDGYDLDEIQNDAKRVHQALTALPEFRNSILGALSDQTVEREFVRMHGRACLNGKDILAGRKYDGQGVKNAWPAEFWDADRGPRYDYLRDGDYYEIPPECQQSAEIENLFAAGRSISADSAALASVRMSGTCLSLGEQAAKTAADYLKTARPYNFYDEIRARSGGNTALSEKGRLISYSKLISQADALAGELVRLGIKRAERIGIFIREDSDYVILNLAVLKLRAVIVPLHSSSAQAEIENAVHRIQLDWLIFDPDFYPDKNGTALTGPSGCIWNAVSFETQMPEQQEFERLNPAFIRFTSGTTGASKGVVISHETIRSRTAAAQEVLNISEKDKILWTLSMAYHFVVSILLFLREGAEIILCGHESEAETEDALKKGGITFIYGSPMQYKKIIQMHGVMAQEMQRVRMAVSTTAQLPQPVAAAFAARFGFELTPVYGIIELGLPFINRSADASKRQSVGFPSPGFECELRGDKQGGRIYLKGPGMFDAYFSPWKTRLQVCPDGWFETGDMGRIGDDGMRILGRSEQVIQFMGMKIFPAEVESVLLEFPGVSEAFVYGETHAAFGQIPKAKIVMEPGCSFSEDDLRIFCYSRLSQFKVPKTFECVLELNHTPSGKISLQQQ